MPATLEYLETRGVPVVAIGQAELPGFYARSSGVPAPVDRVAVETRPRIARHPLGLGLGGRARLRAGPAAEALAEEVARDAVERADRRGGDGGHHGPALTPWLLARIAERPSGGLVRANTALIVNNARVAGQLAAGLAEAAQS